MFSGVDICPSGFGVDVLFIAVASSGSEASLVAVGSLVKTVSAGQYLEQRPLVEGLGRKAKWDSRKMLEGPGSVDQETEFPGSRSRVGGKLLAGRMLQDYE